MTRPLYDGERAHLLAKRLRDLSGESLADCRIAVERLGVDRVGVWLQRIEKLGKPAGKDGD